MRLANMDFLRKCPSCGRRFGVRLLGKKLVDEQSETETETMDILIPAKRGGGPTTSIPERITYTTDKFELSYQCSKCGHAWTEKSMKVKRSG